jgi:hypothetical protein
MPLWNWFSETSIQCKGIEDFTIVVVICCVCVKDTHIGQLISNMQIIWQVSAEDEKSIPDLKNNLFLDIANFISYLVATQFLNFTSHNPSKNTGSIFAFCGNET